jgi:hypothetical protein
MSNHSLIPTLENTICYFVKNTIPSLSDTSNTDVDVRFDFIEDEVKDINNKSEDKDINTIKVRDYKKFFSLLRDIYECDMDAFEEFEKEPYSYYRMSNFFKDLWVRASNIDFEDVEEFLRKEIEMYGDNTFKDLNEEQYLCNLCELGYVDVTVKNKLAKTWDETPYEMSFRFYDDYYFTSHFKKTFYELPRVRYGIYTENGEKICRVGSIQNNIDRFEDDEYASKKINRAKYKLIDNKEDYDNLEPNKVLAFMLFIKLLNDKGIDKVELPSMYVLDYNYHLKRNKLLDDELNAKKLYNDEDKVAYKEFYKENYGKEDIISKSKSEDLSRIGMKAKDYLPSIDVLDVDNRLLLDISNLNKSRINNKLIDYLYDACDLQNHISMNRSYSYSY